MLKSKIKFLFCSVLLFTGARSDFFTSIAETVAFLVF